MKTQAIHLEHEHLGEHVEHIRLAAQEVPRLSTDERTQLIERILDFLRGELLPHASAEEVGLYVDVGTLLGNPDATATMTYDHRAIGERIEELAEVDARDTDRVQELLYGLFALIEVHVRKEEELYFPLVGATKPFLFHRHAAARE